MKIWFARTISFQCGASGKFYGENFMVGREGIEPSTY